MSTKTMLITGAAGNLGSALARSAREKMPDVRLELADINAAALAKVAEETGAVRSIMGDLFDENSQAHQAVAESCADVIVWNAAINLDRETIPIEARTALRAKQNASLWQQIHRLTSNDPVQRRLLVVINSIVSLFGKQLPFLEAQANERHWHYGLMKSDQARMLEESRVALLPASVNLSVLYPGAFQSDFTDAGAALAHNNALGRKKQMKGFMGREDWQQPQLLKPREMSDAVINMVRYWKWTGTMPEKARQWIMLNVEDLAL